MIGRGQALRYNAMVNPKVPAPLRRDDAERRIVDRVRQRLHCRVITLVDTERKTWAAMVHTTDETGPADQLSALR